MTRSVMHSFCVEDAEKYGILEAVILQNIRYWVEKNEANEKHFYDGRYWTYNSVQAWVTMFPYASKDQIRRAMDKLREHGAVVTGNFNSSPYDRTMWYSTQIDLAPVPNGSGREATPIPNINTDINTHTDDADASSPAEAGSACKQVPYRQIVDAYNDELPELPKVRSMNGSRMRAIKCRWMEMLNSKVDDAIDPETGKPRIRYTDADSGIEWWRRFFRNVKNNPHWMGHNDSGWTADLDWLLKPSNFVRALDYKPKKQQGNS